MILHSVFPTLKGAGTAPFNSAGSPVLYHTVLTFSEIFTHTLLVLLDNMNNPATFYRIFLLRDHNVYPFI